MENTPNPEFEDNLSDEIRSMTEAVERAESCLKYFSCRDDLSSCRCDLDVGYICDSCTMWETGRELRDCWGKLKDCLDV